MLLWVDVGASGSAFHAGGPRRAWNEVEAGLLDVETEWEVVLLWVDARASGFAFHAGGPRRAWNEVDGIGIAFDGYSIERDSVLCYFFTQPLNMRCPNPAAAANDLHTAVEPAAGVGGVIFG